MTRSELEAQIAAIDALLKDNYRGRQYKQDLLSQRAVYQQSLDEIIIGHAAHNIDQGFIDYNDVGTSSSPIALTVDTWTTITNDGSGAFTNKVYGPVGVSDLMTSSGELDFSELPLGTAVLIRNDYTVVPAVNNTILDARYLLGTGAGEYALGSTVATLSHGSGQPYQFALNTSFLYMGDTNTRDNVGRFQLRTSYDATVTNAGSVIHVLGT